MAALMKATIDRDDSLGVTTTYQQKTISLEKAREMRQRPPALMDEEGEADASSLGESRQSTKASLQGSVIVEEDERERGDKGQGQGLAISGLDDAKALLEFAGDESGGGEGKRRDGEGLEDGVVPGVVSMA